MEKSTATNIAKENIGLSDDGGTHVPSCPFWILGDEDSAKNDLDDKFEIVDDEEN